jgi:hypothetical protein
LRRVKRKFSDLVKARREADFAAIKLSNGEAEILKLSGTDRADYVDAMRHLRTWNEHAHLNLAVTDYVAAVKRLPENTSLKEVVDFYLKHHPVGLPQKSVQEVVGGQKNSARADSPTCFRKKDFCFSGIHCEDWLRPWRIV